MNVSRKSVIISLVWKLLERTGSQLAVFLLGIILARLLTPTEYGTVSLITVFISIATVFVQGGFNTALIQRPDASDEDYSSVLYFSLGVAVLLYGLLFFCAPLIARFYQIAKLTAIVRVLALMLIPGAFISIQVAYVTKRLQFRKLFLSNMAAVLLSGLLGIVLAKMGFGPWAIVAQQLGTQIIVCLMLMLLSDWKPRLYFSMRSIRRLIPFGSRVLLSNLLVAVFRNVRTLVIGRVYSAEELAYFNRGKTFPATVDDAVNTTIQSVMLPTFSSVQDRKDQLLSMLRRSVRVGCYLIFPCLLGLAAVAEPFIRVILTEKWMRAVPFLRIFAVGYLTQPFQMATNQALKASGRSDLSLRIEIYRKISEVALLAAAIAFGPIMIAWSSVAASVTACMVSAPIIKKHLNYSYRNQLLDVLPSLLLSGILFAAVYGFIRVTDLGSLPALIAAVPLGALLYLGFSALTRNREYAYLLQMIRKR